VEDVIEFLKQHALEKFTEIFRQNNINGKRLLKLTDEDLIELGVSLEFDRKNILEEIDKIRSGLI
jgi:hypothetical protein